MRELTKDALAAIGVFVMVVVLAYLYLRAIDAEALRSQTYNIDEPEFHQTSAIVCNPAVPPQVRRQKKVTFA